MYYVMNNGNLFYSKGAISEDSAREKFESLVDYLKNGDLVEINGKVAQVLEVDDELYVYMNMNVKSVENKITRVWRLNGNGNYVLKFVREEDES